MWPHHNVVDGKPIAVLTLDAIPRSHLTGGFDVHNADQHRYAQFLGDGRAPTGEDSEPLIAEGNSLALGRAEHQNWN